jgi:hypothetical protein
MSQVLRLVSQVLRLVSQVLRLVSSVFYIPTCSGQSTRNSFDCKGILKYLQ